MKFGNVVPQFNMHRLTESDFRFDVTVSRWRPWRHFMQKTAATWWVNTKCLPSASSWVIGCTFVRVSVAGWVVSATSYKKLWINENLFDHRMVAHDKKICNTGNETNFGINLSLNYNLSRCNSAFPNIVLFFVQFWKG